MKELGLSGASLASLVDGVAKGDAEPAGDAN
jgi:hypothetical protein